MTLQPETDARGAPVGDFFDQAGARVAGWVPIGPLGPFWRVGMRQAPAARLAGAGSPRPSRRWAGPGRSPRPGPPFPLMTRLAPDPGKTRKRQGLAIVFPKRKPGVREITRGPVDTNGHFPRGSKAGASERRSGFPHVGPVLPRVGLVFPHVAFGPPPLFSLSKLLKEKEKERPGGRAGRKTLSTCQLRASVL